MQKVRAVVVGVADKQISVLPVKGPYSEKLYGFTPPLHTDLKNGDIVHIELDEYGVKSQWHYT